MADGEPLVADLQLNDDAALATINEVGSALTDATTVDVNVGGDTGGAADTAASIRDVGKASDEASAKTAGFSGSLKGVEGAALLATGQVGGMRTVVQGFGASAIPAVAGSLALAGGIGKIAQTGVEALSATQRFNAILGDMRKNVEEVHVGNLSTSLFDLGTKMGTTNSSLENASASVFQLGKNSGLTNTQSAQLTQNLAALAARSVALNPSLGDMSSVMDNLSLRLARGGAFASRLGVSLSATEIAAKAAALGFGSQASALTIGEKAYAASQVAIEKYGSTLDQVVTKGSQNAAIQQRSLKAALDNTIEAAAKPVAIPFLQTLKAAEPGAAALGQALGALAKDAMPAVEAAAKAVAPPLEAIAAAFQVLGPLVTAGIEAWFAYEAALRIVSPLLGAAATGLLNLGAAEGIAQEEMATLAVVVDETSAGIAASAPLIGILVGGLALGASAFGLFGGGADQAAVDTGSFTDAVTKANGAIDDFGTKAATDVFKKTGDSLHNLAEAGVHVSEVMAGISQGTKGTGDALNKIASTSKDLSDILDGKLNRHLNDAYDANVSMQTGVDNANKALTQQIKALTDTDPALAAVVQRLREQGQLTPDVAKSIAALNDGYDKGQKSASDYAKTGSDAAAANQDVQQSAQDAAKAVGDLANALKGAADSYLNQWQSAIKVNDTTIAADKAYQDYHDTLAKNPAFSAAAVKANDDLQGAVIAQAQAVYDATAAQHQNDDATTQTIVSTRAQIAALEASKAKYPELAPVIDTYIAKLQSIPGVAITNADFVPDWQDVNSYLGALGAIDFKIRQINSTPILSPTFSITPQKGTPIPGHPGEFVGQHGLLVPGRPGEAVPVLAHAGERILSADETRAASDGGGVTVTTTFVNQAPIYGVDQLEDTVGKMFDQHDAKLALALRSRS